MADLGTVVLIEVDGPLSTVTSYGLGGTTQPGPTVPTTGQIWPRGQGT